MEAASVVCVWSLVCPAVPVVVLVLVVVVPVVSVVFAVPVSVVGVVVVVVVPVFLVVVGDMAKAPRDVTRAITVMNFINSP